MKEIVILAKKESEKIDESSVDSLKGMKQNPEMDGQSFNYALSDRNFEPETSLEGFTQNSNLSDKPASMFEEQSLNGITFATQPNPQCDMDHTEERDVPPSQTTFNQNFLDELVRQNLKSEHTNLEGSDELLLFE